MSGLSYSARTECLENNDRDDGCFRGGLCLSSLSQVLSDLIALGARVKLPINDGSGAVSFVEVTIDNIHSLVNGKDHHKLAFNQTVVERLVSGKTISAIRE